MADESDALRREVSRLRAENARLTALLRLTPAEVDPPGPSQTGVSPGRVGPVDSASSAQAKVAFFLDLFASRTDVYARWWSNARKGTSGWSPAIEGRWFKGIDARAVRHLPLTPVVVHAHLAGEMDLGLYPLLPGDQCRWLAVDFDGSAAMLDALAFLKAARAAGVPSALEVSRSGLGAHVWIFFASAVPAAAARRMGTGLLREAMAIRGRMSLSSYDRLFPSQDVVPVGGMGNLIAAPLQGKRRKAGTTVFLDLATMEPYEDQWAYLSTVVRMTPREVLRVGSAVRDPGVGARVERLTISVATRITVPVPDAVHVTAGARLQVATADLTPGMAATLMHAASLRNPDFDERQRNRRPTWNVPRYLISYDQTATGDLLLPRGLLDLVSRLTAEQGSRLALTDLRSDGEPVSLSFNGTLRREQEAAVDAVLGHDLGVLVAPPGSGKTVIACAVAARHGVSTLILVDRKALADQWRRQIADLVGVTPGQIGGGRTKRRGTVDVAMLQTLARRSDVETLTAGYGLIVVDECHHTPAAAFENVVRQIPARRWLGLTATLERRDGLDDLIPLQLGPVRHTMLRATHGIGMLPDADAVPAPEPHLVLHGTDYRYDGDADPSRPGGIAAIYRHLVADDARLTQVVEDVADALARGRRCLVLTQWTGHVNRFEAALRDRGHDPVVLVGGISAKARAEAIARLTAPPADATLLVVATGPYVGEGFDCPALDTVFLAAPISFDGRLVQYVGRVMRPWPGKATAEVHDYVDTATAVLAASLRRRAPGYVRLGFPDPRRLTPLQPRALGL